MEKKEFQYIQEKMILEENNNNNNSNGNIQNQPVNDIPEKYQKYQYDFKQYTFAPLLLFTDSSYFEKGFSNYNSVEEFYRNLLLQKYELDMLHNVIYERKNMKYDELTNHCIKNQCMIVCCIDEHFTALSILSSDTIIYYDPMSQVLKVVYGAESCQRFVVYHLMKCKYGDQGHVSENKDYYTGGNSNRLQQYIYSVWKNLMDLTVERLSGVKEMKGKMNLSEYIFFNHQTNPSNMSTQATGNTCYFQTYLFCLLMRASQPNASKNTPKITLNHQEKLKQISIDICDFTLQFYQSVDIIRPYSNNNIISDFFRYKESPYFSLMKKYLKENDIEVKYVDQYTVLRQYLEDVQRLQRLKKINQEEKMPSSINTKQLQMVTDTENAREKLCKFNYYKYRPANMTFGFNTNIMRRMEGFNEFNALRKNFLLSAYEDIKKLFQQQAPELAKQVTKYRDFYFMPQYEIGQQELVDVHFYTYFLDILSLLQQKGSMQDALQSVVKNVNSVLLDQFKFSMNKQSNYEKIMPHKDFVKNKNELQNFLLYFMTLPYFKNYCALGFNEFNPKEKEINCLTQSVFYDTELMRRQMYRMEYEFERECVNQMAKSTLQKYMNKVDYNQSLKYSYNVQIKIGFGITYSKYNNLLHFINVIGQYWNNPDINYIQIFGKDIRNILGIICQKITISDNHNYYNYGHMETTSQMYNKKYDLLLGQSKDAVSPLVSLEKKDGVTNLVISDRVYSKYYLKNIVENLLRSKNQQIKTDDEILNLCLLSIMLDLNLYDKYGGLLNISYLNNEQDKKKLQIQISNMINEMDKNNKESIQRSKIENLINELSHKFLVNAFLDVQQYTFKIINLMNSDQFYQPYILLCKIYMSLCQINKSIELDYYKVKCDDSYKIIIPYNYSHTTSDYLDQITHSYHFYEEKNFLCYDNMKFIDISQSQPEINLFKIRLKSHKPVETMYKYIEISNAFQVQDKFVSFCSGNILVFSNSQATQMMNETSITLNNIPIELDVMYFNDAYSLIPCFKYVDNENKNSDVALLTSSHLYYHIDTAGQFNENFYGMKFELIECIKIERIYVDLNDQHKFQVHKLCDLITESKTVLFYPHFLLQAQSQDQLISLIDLALKLRNITFFLLCFFLFKRTTMSIGYIQQEKKTKKIVGPWLQALLYSTDQQKNAQYDAIIKPHFFNINHYKDLPLPEFIDVICENFTKYQKHLEDDSPQIVPTQKQKKFIERIIKGEESFFFSEVGSGKTKVILPILCQIFLSNHYETHKYLSKNQNDSIKQALFIIVPEHLVLDAKAQVFRYCLNLNFRKDYKVYDDVFYLLHDDVQVQEKQKLIFISSFNQFKKALTNDQICAKLYPKRKNVQIIIDEVDDFLDRDKLVFNICQNKNNDFQQDVLEQYYYISKLVYELNSNDSESQNIDIEAEFQDFNNPYYWQQLYKKFVQINEEIKCKSKSINKAFGIFNEKTLKHCQNIAHDIEGYKSLIARPYESVNRAMSGSYYSDVERTIFLTYYILMEDTEKYLDLFQQERKNISFEFYMENIYQYHLDYDELIYGRTNLTAIIEQFPETKQPLVEFLYEIILRKMEIHDKSRSVNSVDVIFNFDCTGFTGTPFIDNYPTYEYIRLKKTGKIPDLIDRTFYLHENSPNRDSVYKEKFIKFQGDNNNILVQYHPSDVIQSLENEESILEYIFKQQTDAKLSFNAIVDLCGIFKRITMHNVRNVIKKVFGNSKYNYIYYIDQVTCQDRVLYVENENDIPYDDEFYKYLTSKYHDNVSDKIFYYIDNRNVIGKDIPYQLIFHKQFNKPLIYQSVVIAHDIDDFSKIWQAMGRSRTMNKTKFVIYKSNLDEKAVANQTQITTAQMNSEMEIEIDHNQQSSNQFVNMQNCEITKLYYIQNCDKKIMGNISSMYQTLIAIYNLSRGKFYHDNEIVNIFLLKMNGTINKLLSGHISDIYKYGFQASEKKNILKNIIMDKFAICDELDFNKTQNSDLSFEKNNSLLGEIIVHVIRYKFEQLFAPENLQKPINPTYEKITRFLAGENEHQMEVSYTKQQQKQKQNQQNKNQDKDTMSIFDRDRQILKEFRSEDYFLDTKLRPESNFSDPIKDALNFVAFAREITLIKYKDPVTNKDKSIRVYPTIQFLQSLHLNSNYIDSNLKTFLSKTFINNTVQYDMKKYFLEHMQTRSLSKTFPKEYDENDNPTNKKMEMEDQSPASDSDDDYSNEVEHNHQKILRQEKHKQKYFNNIKVYHSYLKQNPQFNLMCLGEGVFVIGMKNQFSESDLTYFPLRDQIHYVCDESCHILYSNQKCQNDLGQTHKVPSNQQIHPVNCYNLDLYIFLDCVTKQELANNVVQTFYNPKNNLKQQIDSYNGEQGDGFICWRFIMRKSQQEKMKELEEQ